MKHAILSLVSLTAGCSSSEEAARVELPVTTSAAPFTTTTTNLGYAIDLWSVRIGAADLELTIDGEMHQDATAARVVGPVPHPGHAGGGEVTGELPGNFVLEWNGEAHAELGLATLIAGDYNGANFTFRAATAAELPAGDPMIGHAFHLTGTIAKDGMVKPFDALLDVEPFAKLIGAVFEDTIDATSTETLALRFFPVDPFESDTAFDDVDFFALPATADGALEIRPGSDIHNLLRREIQVHDVYGVDVL